MTLLARAQAPRHRVPYERWVVIGGPFVVASTVSMFGPVLDKAIAAVVGALVVGWLSHRPGAALRWLGVLLPFQLLVLAGLYEAGAPAQLVRGLGYVKDVLIAALVVAAFRAAKVRRLRLDLLDKLALGYVALVVAYLLIPGVFVDGPAASLPVGVRFNGFRSDAMYVVLFLAARHARLAAHEVARAARAFVTAGLVAAGLGVYEFIAASSWNRIVTETLGLPRYRVDLLKARPGDDPYLFDVRVYTLVAGREVLRIGGVLVSYLAFGFYLIVTAALLIERQVRKLDAPARAAGIALIGLAVLFTQTRAAVVGFVLVLALSVRPLAGRRTSARVRLAVVVGVACALALPVVGAIGLSQRFAGEDDASSNELHGQSSSAGVSALLDEPLGRGLATAAGVAQQEAPDLALVTENQLLQIGVQLGLLGLALWVSVYVAAARTLRRVVMAHSGEPGGEQAEAKAVAAATSVVLVGLAPAMLFLQIYIYFPFAWPLWALAGAALGCLEGQRSGLAVGQEPAGLKA